MAVEKIVKKVRLSSRDQAIRLQLMIDLVFMRQMDIIGNDMDCMIKLVEWGPMPLKEFCGKMVVHLHGIQVAQDVEKYHLRNQSIRNRLSRLEKLGLVVRSKDAGKNVVALNPRIGVKSLDEMLLEYNFLYIETEKDKGSVASVVAANGVL